MPTNAITETEVESGGWQTAETAPSALRADEPRFARWIGGVGLLFVALAGFSFLFQAGGMASRIGPGARIFLIATGLACMLFHASRDGDLQVRRTYGLFGYLWVFAAILAGALSLGGKGGQLFLYGFFGLPLGLLFLLAFVRHESELVWRRMVLATLGLGAVGLAAAGFIGGNISADFLLPYGLILALVGLAYWWAFVSLQGASSDGGYWSGVAMGATGLAVFCIALARSVLPPLFASWGWIERRAQEPYVASAGLMLMTLGILYAGLAAGLCSDNRLIVLTRRELSAFFYSPTAYIVFISLTLEGAVLYGMFVDNIFEAQRRGSPMFEPIVENYIFSLVPVISMILVVPVLTMRLLSEERQTGTLEVLLTAPLGETSVVLSKFVAALIFFMVLWIPWGLFLVALRIQGGQPFDYRPLLSFFVALACTGAGFLSMGLFFSSLTRNQIVAAVLSFVGMIVLFSVFFIGHQLSPTSAWHPVLVQASFIDLWWSALKGKLVPRDLLFPLSSAVFFLFLTGKVLEARKWS